MKLTKKITTLFLALALVIGTSVTAFAAPTDDVVTALQNTKVPATYIIQAENYLKTTTVTTEEATAVITQITKASDIFEASGVTSITELNDADKQAILACITAAANALGLDISIVTESNGEYSIVVTDSNGNIVFEMSQNEVKQTGMDNSIIYAGILLVVLAAGSVFVLRKSNLKATA